MSARYTLNIELSGSDPKIWRRLTVPGNTTFDNLHDIIQISMGWNNEYPFEFDINGTIVYDFGPDIDMGENPYERDALDTSLDELVTMVRTRFQYTYNHWEHEIMLEEILPQSEHESEEFVCMAGEGSCPPDDLGGIEAGKTNGVAPFDIDNVNARLARYAADWEDIYEETEEIMDQLDGEHDDEEITHADNQDSEYERLKHLRSPSDLLNDDLQKRELQVFIDDALVNEDSAEYKAFTRLINLGHGEEESRAMILRAFAIEWFYDLKYGTDFLIERYEFNLERLPETPLEIDAVDCAIQVLDQCTKGIPFAAIEYLHDDTSPESRSAIVQALKDYADHRSDWADPVAAPIWYAFAAEGHLCEELIDPIIGFYTSDHENATDWINEQGQYLIGKLAQKYPDSTVQRVLAALESLPDDDDHGSLYFLFDVFDFCDIETYKGRLLALLERDGAYWHDMLATTISHLQIQEALPILKEQLRRFKERSPEKQFRDNGHRIEIEEAIKELEAGEELYPDVSAPLCLQRSTTWREELADAEEHFYESAPLPEVSLDPDWRETYQQPIVKTDKTGRNDPCPCGSGKKYKKCCMNPLK